MLLLQQLIHKIGQAFLNNEVRHLKMERKIMSLHDAGQIGILFHAAAPDEERKVENYADKLRSEGKKVFMLGYVDEKELPERNKHSVTVQYFCRSDLNSYLKPISSKVKQFERTSFDMLLCLFATPVLPLLYVSAHSKANYRTGPQMENGLKYFDGIIDTGEIKSIDFLIEQMDFYLKVI